MAAPVPLSEAARVLGVDVSTLRRWCREGAPVAAPGGRGRGRASRVDIDAVARWRDEKGGLGHESLLREIAALALDFHRRGAEAGEPGWRLLGIPEHRAAALVAFLLDYLAIRMLKAEDFQTPEMQLLASIARGGR